MNSIANIRVSERRRYDVLGSPIDHTDWRELLDRFRSWSARRESRYVCVCNVHSVVTGRTDSKFGAVLADADTAIPDGMPVAWFMRKRYRLRQDRISGPDFMWRYFSEAAGRRESIFLYGGQSRTLEILEKKIKLYFPSLVVAGMYSPPFRALTRSEDEEVIQMINQSGAHSVWVGLGCPKQERWMADHRGKIQAPMVGVGAAFDYHAGTVRRAPGWMQSSGLEWLHRLSTDPRRLWRRYLLTNSLFIYHASVQLMSTGKDKTPN